MGEAENNLHRSHDKLWMPGSVARWLVVPLTEREERRNSMSGGSRFDM